MGTLWYGGSIYTLQHEGHMVEAVYTEGNKIVGTGGVTELESKYKNRITERKKLTGKTMLPGFVDSHIHLIGFGETIIRLDLSKYSSKQAVLEAVRDYAKQIPDGAWVIGEGWNENLWESPEILHRSELDQVVPNHPVALKRVCRHAVAANSLALKYAGITRNTVCPPGGVIETDQSGEPTGVLKDQAQELVYRVLPDVPDTYLQTALRVAIKRAYQLGLTGVHTEDLNYYGSFQRTFAAFKTIIEEESLKFRAHLLVHYEVMDEMETAGAGYLSGNEWIEFGAIKLFADGALGGRTALLSHPYADDPAVSGVAIHTQDQLNEIVKKARKMKMPVAIHAIGDLAFEYALNAIEFYPLQGMGRDRLIHAQILRRDLIERAKRLPLILDIQPRFLASDFPWVIERVGKERMKYGYAWYTLFREGLHCAGGSDAPIEPADPLLGIHAAVTRTNIDDPEKTVYDPEEALPVYDAVCLFTKGSAYAVCHEHDRGMIQEGFAADFTILADNIFMVNIDDIARIKVAMTVIGGEVVYEQEKTEN